MFKTLLLALTMLASVGCSDKQAAERALAASGVDLTQVKFTGYQFFGCSDDDLYHTGFTLLKDGEVREGVVCGGPLKGMTIRWK